LQENGKDNKGDFSYTYQCYYCYKRFENQGFYDNHVSIKQQEKTDYHGEAELKNMD